MNKRSVCALGMAFVLAGCSAGAHDICHVVARHMS